MKNHLITYKQALELLQVCLYTPQTPFTQPASLVHHVLITYSPAFISK